MGEMATEDGSIMKARIGITLLGCCIVALAGFFFGMPMLARRGGLYSGSYEYAHRWAEQLATCDSLEDVKKRFNCIRIDWFTDGHGEQVQVSNLGKGKASALLHTCPDGNWVACAYANSHGDPAGGTLVARDSEGTIRVFFGHICGKPSFVGGDTLAEVYATLSSQLTEVSLEQGKAIDANAPPAMN